MNPTSQLTTTRVDEAWMAQALAQAVLGAGRASPNPTVGCVILKNEQVIGQGFHDYADKEHAEIVALRQAGIEARGATAYVTLEPCNTQGRTGPCADALIGSGVARVVVATMDPNPAVNGCGIQRLEAAGISVDVGIKEREARRLNDAFAHSIRNAMPLVTLKAGLSLDGRIAPAPSRELDPAHPGGAPRWITGEESRAEVHRMRHRSDAILLGIGSALADDPLLTDRSGLPRRRPLLRGILDSELRLPPDSRLVRTAAEDLIVFCTSTSEPDKSLGPDKQLRAQALRNRGVELVELAAGADSRGRVAFKEVLKWLAAKQVISVLLEGGSTLNAQALEDDLVDKVCWFYAPKILGGDAVPLFASLHPGDLQGPQITLKQVEFTRFGEDLLVCALIHDPWVHDPWAHNPWESSD